MSFPLITPVTAEFEPVAPKTEIKCFDHDANADDIALMLKKSICLVVYIVQETTVTSF